MSGIYIHIPYCVRKCYYCNFYSTTVKGDTTPLINAIGRESELRIKYLEDNSIETLYIGGGTPSIIQPAQLQYLIKVIKSNFLINNEAEITIEANPDDINSEFLDNIRNLGFNRISLGVQSFRDEDLKALGRRHHAGQAMRAIDMILSAGFSNFSIDLIFGMNTLTDAGWEKNLHTFLSYDIPHLSAYSLTVEPGTTLEKMIQKKISTAPEEDKVSRHFITLMEIMAQNGYLHYEISNFAKEGYVSKHNSSYWKGIPYIGLGPAAHSFNGTSRQWNIDNIGKYIHSIENDYIPCTSEMLSCSDMYNEYIMTSLRTIWGVHDSIIINRFGEKLYEHFLKNKQKHLSLNNICSNVPGSWILTSQGKLFADSIVSDFFLPDNFLSKD